MIPGWWFRRLAARRECVRHATPGLNATGKQNNEKLLDALRGKTGKEREAYFVCALAVAREGNVLAVITNRVDGAILEAPRGAGGFGYDPVFFLSSFE